MISGNSSFIYDGDWNTGALHTMGEGNWLDAASQDTNPYAAGFARLYEEAITWNITENVVEGKKKSEEINSIDSVVISEPITTSVASPKNKVTRKIPRTFKPTNNVWTYTLAPVQETPRLIVLNGKRKIGNVLVLN